MEKKVYYGEYTLWHWIQLILKQNIVLPEYQRNFVWSKESVGEFIQSIKNDLFVPPIILGAFKKAEGTTNIILDGQQRLSSILLAYLGLYPKEDVFKKKVEPLYSAENEDIGEDDEYEIIEWSFKELLHKHHLHLDKSEVKSHIDLEKYDSLDPKDVLYEDFLKNHYLGFSYIVPATTDNIDQQKFYSSVFRNINQQGVRLAGQESRRALYYLNAELVPFFEPECFKQVKVSKEGRNLNYDFVRALAFLSQYAKQGNEKNIAVKCYRQDQLEQLYDSYINLVVVDGEDDKYNKFSVQIGLLNLADRLRSLTEYVKEIGISKTYSTIIEADLYAFGLIYQVLIEGRKLKIDKVEDLKAELNQKFESYKLNDSHRKGPNKVSYLRIRIKDSITIYKKYVDAQP